LSNFDQKVKFYYKIISIKQKARELKKSDPNTYDGSTSQIISRPCLIPPSPFCKEIEKVLPVTPGPHSAVLSELPTNFARKVFGGIGSLKLRKRGICGTLASQTMPG
jgi:hypothetical protein